MTTARRALIIQKLPFLVHASCILLLVGQTACIKKSSLFGSGTGYTESELRAYKGIQISSNGPDTSFKVPCAQVKADDQKVLFDAMLQNYLDALDGLKKDHEGKVSKVKGLDKIAQVSFFHDQIRKLVAAIATDLTKNNYAQDKSVVDPSKLDPNVYADIQQQNIFDSYNVSNPQGFIIYAAMNVKIKGSAKRTFTKINGGRLGFTSVTQCFLNVTIDNTSKKEKLDSTGKPVRKNVFSTAFFFTWIPGIEFTAGDVQKAGLEPEYQVDGGLLYGPFETPDSLLGYAGIGLDVDIDDALVPQGRDAIVEFLKSKIPVLANLGPKKQKSSSSLQTGVRKNVVEGLHGRLMAMGKLGKPPVYAFMLGYQTGQGGISGELTFPMFVDPVGLVGMFTDGLTNNEQGSNNSSSSGSAGSGIGGPNESVLFEVTQ